MAAVTALWPVAAWRSPWLIIPFQCFSYHYCPSHRNTNVYMALGNIPLELKPHPLCVGYVTSLVICLWLIICCTRLGTHKPNWVSCSFCHILLMMISVLYFLRYCQYSCLFSAIELLSSTSRPFHVNGIRYRGAVVWNLILQDGTNTDVPEAVFKKCLKRLISTVIIP